MSLPTHTPASTARRHVVPAPVARLLSFVGFIFAAVLSWHLFFGEVTLLTWVSAVMIFVGTELLVRRRTGLSTGRSRASGN